MNLKEITERNGGLTMELTTGKLDPHATGYYVGGLVPSVTIHRNSNAAGYSLTAYGMRNTAPLNIGRAYLGTWIDTDTDTVYFDLSEHFTDRTEAMRVARIRGEIAIWDIANGAEIRL